MRRMTSSVCFWFLAVFFIVGSSSALAEGRAYIGVETGFSMSGDLDSAQFTVNHPTRCDKLLYETGMPPDDPACASDKTSSFENTFSPGAGIAGGVTLGYDLDSGLRFEAEYFYSRQGKDRNLIPLGSDSDDPLDQKTSEWEPSNLPYEEISDISTHNFFLNVYYDLHSDSPFVPYVGAGVGMGSTQMTYLSSAQRKDPLGDAQWQKKAAGTTSYIDTELEKTRFGFQVAGGVDYELTPEVSFGVKVRWIRLNGFDSDGELWDSIRDHEPVRADGVTPFTSDIEIGDASSLVVTLGLKYYF